MAYRNTTPIYLLAFATYSVLLVSPQCLVGQIGFCGGDPPSLLPEGMSLHTANGKSKLHIETGSSSTEISLPGGLGEIRDVCRLQQDRVLILGQTGRGLYVIALVDRAKAVLLDYFYGYGPALSKDKRWLIRCRFFPASFPASEQYLMYDLSKDAAANRPPGIGLDDKDAVGALVYPVETGKMPAENLLPDDEEHRIASAFYWDSNSQSVVFADRVKRQLSVVLLVLDGDAFRAYVKPITHAQACPQPLGEGVAESSLGVYGARTSRIGDERLIYLDVGSASAGCPPRPLVISSREFEPARPETHAPRPPRKPAARWPFGAGVSIRPAPKGR